jgi:uncharacterized protein YdaU (DUF1376 family)
MATYPSLPLFTDAFIADTGHLGAMETGAYLMLLMMAWRTSECRLPDDDAKLSRWARVDMRTWKRIKPEIMSFWTLDNGFWTQGRLMKERASVSKRAEAARENGLRGGRPKLLETNTTTNPMGSSWASQEKAPISISISKGSKINLEPCPKRVRTTYSDQFEEFWKGYPTDANMSKKEAFDVWKRLTSEKRAAALASLPAFRLHCQAQPDYRPIHACRYLSKERFEGHVATAQKLEARRFIEQGTPQWDAWQEHLIAERGRGSPSTKGIVNGRSVSGWTFDAEYPPNYHDQQGATQ